MPAEIDTGGHRVLHCDSRADCPTASIRVSSPASGERACLPVRNNDSESRIRARKKNRRKTESRRARPLNCRRATNSRLNRGESSSTRVSRIEDKEEAISGGRDFLAKCRVLTQPPRRRQGRNEGEGNEAGLLGACRVSRESSCAIEDVAEDESFSVTWSSRANAGSEIERAESRLRGKTDQRRVADANVPRRGPRNRSRTRPRPLSYENEILGSVSTDRLGRIRNAGGNSLLSSHRSRTRAEETDFNDIDEGFFSEEFDGRRTSENRRTDSSEGCDRKRSKDEWDKIDRDSANRKRIGRYRLHSFLQLLCLCLFIVFGRCGPLGSSSVLKVNARPIANSLSVFGIGIIGVVNARSIDPMGDAGIRAERSANLSHMTGPFRNKIQMYIKNRHLQIFPDGTVNGSNDDTSDYTIFQRTSVGKDGQLIIQSLATCLFLCMDVCGGLYGSPNCTANCVFNETLEQHNYNTYSSVYWSTANKTLYLGLDRNGQPKKIQAIGHNLGKLSTNARVLTQVAPSDRLEVLRRRILGAEHKVRHWYHHRQISDDVLSNCPKVPPQEKDGRDKFRCRKRKKRKKRKRRCRPNEQPGPQCHAVEETTTESVTDVMETSSELISFNTTPESKRSCEGAASEEACRRQALSVPAKKRKSRIDGGRRNLTLGKNKASTAKKPNANIADNQSKKPDLTDGKKKKKRTTLQTNRGSTVALRQRYGEPGTTSSTQDSSSLTALAGAEEQWALTATLSSSPSLLGASTALFSITRPSRRLSDRKKSPQSPKNRISSRRVGKSFRDNANLPHRSKSMPTTTSRRKIAFLPSTTTKVPEDTCAYTTTPLPELSSARPSSSLSWQEYDDDTSFLPDESSTIKLAIVAVESDTLATSDEVIAEVTTFSDKSCEDSDMADTIPQTARSPIEKLAM